MNAILTQNVLKKVLLGNEKKPQDMKD